MDDAIGDAGVGRALQALIGLSRPRPIRLSDLTTTLGDLLARPTRAIGDVHRRVLASEDHPWSHMLAEIAVLLDLPPEVDGAGSQADPWRVTIARRARWPDARRLERADGADPPGSGTCDWAAAPGWEASWLAELLAFDLPGATGPAGPARGPAPGARDWAGRGAPPLGRAVAAAAIRAIARW